MGLITLGLAGCAIKRPGYDVPSMPLPAHYRNAPTDGVPASINGKAAERSADAAHDEWWRAFGSSELRALIDRGIANNPDIRIATLKLAQVHEKARQVQADQKPAVSATGGTSLQAPGGTVGSVPVGQIDNKTSQRLYQASVRGNWRIDLWGEQSALAESAGLQVWQAAFERDNVQRSLVANLASNYVEYLSLNDRLRIAQEAEVLLSGVLTTIEKRVAADDATVVELEQQKAAIFAVRATIPNLEQQRDDALTNIAFLVGALPSSLSLSRNGLDSLTLPVVAPEQPSSLILRRPDVRMVEAKLLAADADIDAARARLLPPLDLSAQMGYSSMVMTGLFQPLGLFWNTIANMTVSIFDNGKLASQKEQAKVVHEEMVENYARTLYQAIREVERAMSLIRSSSRRVDAQQQATTAAKKAWDISHEIYASGGLDHLTLLDAGRSYLRYLDEYQTIRMDRYRGYISLFQALGGGAMTSQTIPGQGTRPKPVLTTAAAPKAPTPSALDPTNDGVDWPAGKAFASRAATDADPYWQVELPGLYHKVTIAPTWRDLRTRYPQLMEGRIVRPRLTGQVDTGEAQSAQPAWYRLYVTQFPTAAAAESLCTALKTSNQRCRVLSSTSDDTVTVEPEKVADNTPTIVQPAVEEQNAATAPAPDTSAVAVTSLPAEPLPDPVSPKPAAVFKGKKAYAVQFGAFANIKNASALANEWAQRGYETYLCQLAERAGGSWIAVRTGAFAKQQQADELVRVLKQKDGFSALRVPALLDESGQLAVMAEAETKRMLAQLQ